MEERRPSRGHPAVLVAFVLFFLLLLRDTAMRPERPRLPTPLDAHAALRAVSDLAAVRVDELHGVSEGRQVAIMKDVAAFLREEFQIHARREEETLYAAAERRGKAGVVAVLRMEHGILRRWLAELADLAERPMPDHHAFARRAGRLLGLLEAHFETEERLLPGALNGP